MISQGSRRPAIRAGGTGNFSPMTVAPGNERLPAEVLGASFGMLLGAMASPWFGPPGAPLVTALSTPIMEAWAGRSLRELQRRGEDVAAGASKSSHLDESEVVNRLLQDGDLQPLVRRVLDAAVRTSSVDKLRILGAVLGEAVAERPRSLDEDLLIVGALDAIEAPHLRILEAMRDPANASDHDNFAWTPDELAAIVSDLSHAGCQAALGGLQRHGLIQLAADTYGVAFAVTDFGRVLLDAMRLMHETSNPKKAGTRGHLRFVRSYATGGQGRVCTDAEPVWAAVP